MTDERLVIRPNNARTMAIPQEYLAICKQTRVGRVARGERKGEEFTYEVQNEAAAAILYCIERWTIHKLKDAGRALTTADIWVYISGAQMQEFELMGAFSTSQITQGFELLVERGFLNRRNNPKNNQDKTYQYQFQQGVIQRTLDKLSPFFNIEGWVDQHYKSHSSVSKIETSKSKSETIGSEETITQSHTQTPTQTESSGEDSKTVASGQPELPSTEKDPSTPITTVVDIHKSDGNRPEYDTYIGRQNQRAGLPKSKWANPWRVTANPDPAKKQVATAEEAVEHYRDWLMTKPELIAAIPELVGQTLGCWCDQSGACHGQVLAELANHYAAGELDLDALVEAAQQRQELNKPPYVLLIDAWYEGMPADIPQAMRNYTRNVRTAMRLADGGFTPRQVEECTAAKSSEEYWQGRQVPLETIEKDLPLWLKKQPDRGDELEPTTYDPTWAELSPVEQARRKQRESLEKLAIILGVNHERIA